MDFEKLGKKEPEGPEGPGQPQPQMAVKAPGSKAPSIGPTQAPVAIPLPDGKVVTGVIRTRSANIIERVGWTAVQSFVGTFTAVFFGAQQFDMGNLKTAALAGGSAVAAALLAFVKNLITTRLEG